MSQEMPATGGACSLTPQNDVDAGKDGSQLSGWQASDKFRQHRFVDCDNQCNIGHRLTIQTCVTGQQPDIPRGVGPF